jgi:hypothetical protein
MYGSRGRRTGLYAFVSTVILVALAAIACAAPTIPPETPQSAEAPLPTTPSVEVQPFPTLPPLTQPGTEEAPLTVTEVGPVGDHALWAARLKELNEANKDFSDPDTLRRMEEVARGYVETLPEPPKEAQLEGGYTYRFQARDDAVTITFPERLGGRTVTASLVGDFALFIEDDAPNPEAAKVRIADWHQQLNGLVVPVGADREIPAPSVRLDMSMLDRSGVSFERPDGVANLMTGEMQMHTRLTPRIAELEEIFKSLGIEWPTLDVQEVGVLELEPGKSAKITSHGSLMVDSGFFAGTKVSYSPMIALSGPQSPLAWGGDSSESPSWDVNIWVYRDPGACNVYTSIFQGTNTITGKGVAPNSASTQNTEVDSQGKTAMFTFGSTTRSTIWNGTNAYGQWTMVRWSNNLNCQNLPSSDVIVAEMANPGIGSTSSPLKIASAANYWSAVGVLASHNVGPDWCPPGSFITQLDLDSYANLSGNDSPAIGQVKCVAPTYPAGQNPKWGSCSWVKVGPAASHSAGPDWGPNGSYLVQLDLDGDKNYSAYDTPFVGQAKFCKPQLPQAPAWGTCSWVKIGPVASHNPGAAWGPPGSFITQLDFDRDDSLSATDSPIIGQAKFCTLKAP